ncbi:MAG: hypothetical protein QOH75_784, partial [Actinomycetota bacterium]|nr:hypothetical protein [Actinomycetota bacterium]
MRVHEHCTGGKPTMNARKTVTGTPSHWVTATALVLAYGLALWTLWLQHASGLHQHGGPSLPLHWLRDATVTAVQVVVAVRLTVQVADRLLRADRTHLGALLCGAVAASIAYAAWLPVRDTLFPTHAAASLPLVVQVLRDSLVGLVVAVPAVLLLHALFVAQPWRSRRLISGSALRRTVARVAVAVMAVASFATSPLLANAASASESTPWDGNPCPGSAPARSFEITAVDVKIPLNRYGDNDPRGKMYVATTVDGVENKLTAPGDTAKPALEAVRAQEASQKVSIGLRDDPIQPLSI